MIILSFFFYSWHMPANLITVKEKAFVSFFFPPSLSLCLSVSLLLFLYCQTYAFDVRQRDRGNSRSLPRLRLHACGLNNQLVEKTIHIPLFTSRALEIENIIFEDLLHDKQLLKKLSVKELATIEHCCF